MRHGFPLLVAASLFILFIHLNRDRLSQPAPVFLSETPGESRLVELASGFCPEGIYQIFDAESALSVNKLTTCRAEDQWLVEDLAGLSLRQGEKLEIIQRNGVSMALQRSWMVAAQRISLGIPLHPDRMTIDDWLDLPGIGAVTAARIEVDRQKNGDFGGLWVLERVPGLGSKRLGRISGFF